MGSGNRELVVSPLERALSGDIMRLQNFGAAALSEILRAMLDTNAGLDDVDAGALYTPTSTSTTPASAEIFAGLLFHPTGGSTDSSIDSGVIAIYDPDASPSSDDSQYKVVQDPGTTSALTPAIALTGNSSGALRIDVLECARVQPDSVTETDSRDVFNTVTGTYAAAAVNKVSQAQLQYRIRTGTAGAGFPGSAAGWVPLCVMSVPNATTTWDTVTIWDVRPLIGDRIFPLGRASRDLPRVTRCMGQIDATNFSPESRLTGIIEAELVARRVGGLMRPGTPQVLGPLGPDSYEVNLDGASNISAGLSVPTTGFNYVYLLLPYGLPRWARYVQSPASGRVPRSPRGIVCVSTTAPDLAYGTASAAIVLPPCLQDGSNSQVCATARALCVLARLNTSASGTPGGLIFSGGVHWANKATPDNSATVGSNIATFNIVPGTDYPAHARAVHALLYGEFVISGGTLTDFYIDGGTLDLKLSSGIVVTLYLADGNHQIINAATGSPYVNSQTFKYRARVRVPLPSYYSINGTPGSSTPGTSLGLSLIWTPTIAFDVASGGSMALTVATISSLGWELSDSD